MNIPLDQRDVWQPDRPPLSCRPSDQSFVQLDPEAAQPGQQLRAAGIGRPGQEAAVRFDVLHDRTAVALREADGVEDDLEQHLVEHQGRAHRLPDLAQGL